MASSLLPSQLAPQFDSAPRARIRNVVRVLELWHLTSLDAPTVSIVWALAIARSAGVHLEPWSWLLIGCGTWTVYVLDRLLDARRAIQRACLNDLRERHHFHWLHRRILLPLAGSAAVAAVSLIFQRMSSTAREHDSLIAAAALAYFSGVHVPAKLPRWARRVASKEFLVGVLFTAGCAAPTLSRLPATSSPWSIILVLPFFAALAWLNCAAIESWESHANRIHPAVASLALALLGSVTTILLAANHPPNSLLVAFGATSALLIFALDRHKDRIGSVALRALADVALLVPGLLLIPGVLRG